MSEKSISEQISLPEEFIKRMEKLDGFSVSDYLRSFDAESSKGIHLNTRLMDEKSFLSSYGDLFEKLPYGKNAYRSGLDKPGLSPLSHCGLIYSQDPGAMMPVSALPFDIKDGSLILDMCAAPGGKTSMLASVAGNNSVIVANEINTSRNKILQSNMERMGYDNVVITSYNSSKIASIWPSAFDMILIDAPCSGEGMFRKYPEAVNEWSVDNVKNCALRQREIVSNGYLALKDGGIMIYSTCTYSPEENEDIISYLTDEYHMEILTPNESILKYSAPSLLTEKARRFYPYVAYGEGQFLCILKKSGNDTSRNLYPVTLKAPDKKQLAMISDTLKGNPGLMPGSKINYYIYNNSVIAINKNLLTDDNEMVLNLKPASFERLFVIAGTFDKNRFTPHHHLYKAFGQMFTNIYNPSDDDIYKYLRGEELRRDVPNGYGVILYNGAPAGGYKASNGRLKNHYPKGLRNLK
ncbi:MAG: hypothetical protein K6F90_06760 [Lachnospiraceae bacterium]|nr:hypothetical protein [Lachnospiraceae bacterium]